MPFSRNTFWLVLLVLAACQSPPEPSQTASEVTALPQIEQPKSQIADVSPYFSKARSVPQEVQQQFAQTLALQQSGEFAAALANWQGLVDLHPKFSGIWLNKGLVEKQLGQLEAAALSFTKAIDVNKDNQEAYNELAILRREQGDFAAAEVLYLQSIAVWPKHARSHKNLAILYDLYLQDFPKAMQHYSLYAQYAKLDDAGKKQLKGWMLDLERRLR